MKYLIVLGLTLVSSISSYAEEKVLPGNCGTLGCGEPHEATRLEIMGAVIASPELQQSLDKNVRVNDVTAEFYVNDDDLLSLYTQVNVRVSLTKGEHSGYALRCARVEFLELPLSVDGVAPTKIGASWAIITFTLGSCK